jgi:hypothetical protein
MLRRLRTLLGRKPAPRLSHDVIAGLVSLHDACEGLFICGGTGSGKTSFVAAEAFTSLLAHPSRPGGLVLCAKPDEAGRWLGYCRQTGRAEDYCHVAPGRAACDVLSYELSHPYATIESAAELLDRVIEVGTRNGGGQGDESFWLLLGQKIIRRAIGAVWFATGKCSLLALYLFLASAPTSPQQRDSTDWREGAGEGEGRSPGSFCWECLRLGREKHPDDHDRKLGAAFWLEEWPTLAEKTRSIGYAIVTNILDKLLGGPIGKMVASPANTFTPDGLLAGQVQVLDMPVLTWQEPGTYFQLIYKMLAQRAVLRRAPGGRPVFIACDEAQFFVLPETDARVQAVARQSGLISVDIAQNLPLLYAALGGGDRARQQVDAWLSNHMTKVLAANTCRETNQYFSDLLGRSRHLFMNGHSSPEPYSLVDDMTGRNRHHGGWSEQWHPDFPPEDFARLGKPRPPDLVAEAVVFQGGRRYPQNGGKTWVKTTFHLGRT